MVARVPDVPRRVEVAEELALELVPSAFEPLRTQPRTHLLQVLDVLQVVRVDRVIEYVRMDEVVVLRVILIGFYARKWLAVYPERLDPLCILTTGVSRTC